MCSYFCLLVSVKNSEETTVIRGGAVNVTLITYDEYTITRGGVAVKSSENKMHMTEKSKDVKCKKKEE